MDAHFIGIIIGGLLMGALCGLGPLIAGRRRGFKKHGIAGFFTCVLCGGILGILLAGPVALIWTVILLTKQRGNSRDSKPDSI